jgi:RNA polymerase sigma factor (sigma-70 family)
MMPMDDAALLQEYARTGAEAPFTALVQRYAGMVYSSALRQVRDPQAAEDVAQAVFILLARKAKNLSRHPALGGWLLQTTRFAANNHLRGAYRRAQREREAVMQSQINDPSPGVWAHVSPHLDEAMASLGATDRAVIALRYFENKSAAEIAQTLKLNEPAAQKRAHRALEKLRKLFAKKGVVLSTVALASTVAANSVHAAPVALVPKLSLVAGKGLATTATINALVHSTMKSMAYLKIKFLAGIGLAALLIGGVVAVTLSRADKFGDSFTPRQIAQKSRAAYAALSSYSDACKGATSGGGSSMTSSCVIKLQRPNQYRVTWTQQGGPFGSQGIVWSDGSKNYYVMARDDEFAAAAPQTANDIQQAFAFATGVSGSIASTIPAAFFDLAYGEDLAVVASDRGITKVKRLPDQKIGDADCFVVVSVLDPSTLAPAKATSAPAMKLKSMGKITTTLWIGRQDYLIRQLKSVTAGPSPHLNWTDDMLQRQLEARKEPITPENIATLRTEMAKKDKLADKTGYVFTQTHENIVVNQQFPASDFTR